MVDGSATIRFRSLREEGSSIVPYARAWAYQKTLVERRARDEIPDTFLFVEHPETVTRGRGLQRHPGDAREGPRSIPLGPLPAGTDYFEIERGGDLTWHGPGQLVVYPIVKLDGSGIGPPRDVAAYLRRLESVFSEWIRTYGVATEVREGATGIWAGGPERPMRKIASIGIAVRKWVAYHGIGLNLANSLGGYRSIAPCGFDPDVMTSLAAESAKFATQGWSSPVRARIEAEIAAFVFSGEPVVEHEISSP